MDIWSRLRRFAASARLWAPELYSLRTRFTIAAACSIAIVLAIVWLLLSLLYENHIERLVEKELETRLLEIAGSIALDDNDRPYMQVEPTDPRYQRPAGGAYWRVSEQGHTQLRSLSLWDSDIKPSKSLHVSPTGIAVEANGPGDSHVYLAERVVVLPGKNEAHQLRLGAALDIAFVERLKLSFERQVVLTLAIIGVTLSFGAWLQSTYVLRPLAQLKAQLARLHEGAAQRLTGPFPREIGPLIDDLNKLLTRQEDLVRRARERSGDLAHGLKTPLTILQIEARNAAERGESQTAASILEQVEAMKGHVERELSRARFSGAWAGGGVAPRKAVDRLIRIMQLMPYGDRVEWRNEIPESAVLRMDPDDFGEIVGNLLDNARKHARRLVRVTMLPQGNEIESCFDDDGPGISPDIRETLVHRGERARSDDEGSGLGLSIVIESLRQYGLTLAIRTSPEGGCRMAFRALRGFA